MRLLLVALMLCPPAAQEPAKRPRPEFLRVEVLCTALSGDGVYLDQGREAGIEIGDKVRLFPPGSAPRVGRIVSVSRTSARATLASGMVGLDVGLRGEVLVPKERLAPKASTDPLPPAASSAPVTAPIVPEEPPPRTSTEHPPWTAPPEEWNQAAPLLAPAHGVPPEERARRFDGQVSTSLDWTGDSVDSGERTFLSTDLGVSGRVQNPFAHGGELAFDVESFSKRSDGAGESENESRLRIDRASYAWGGVRGERDHGEVGRFLQGEFPELGFLDGIEYVHRMRSESRVGTSVGFLPEPNDVFRTGDDLQAAAFYRFVSGADERFSLGTGYQKTWHGGVADRDLLVSDIEYHPDASTSVFSSLLVDYYTAGDTLKASGFELTQLFLNAARRSEAGHGLGLFLSRFRWPDIERNEFPDVTAQEIADAVTSRVGLDGWLELGRGAQLYGRAESWSDQDDSGGSGRARVTLRDVYGPGQQLALESYLTAGKFSRTTGLRLTARRRFQRGTLALSWDATRFDQNSVQETLLQHSLRGQLDLRLGSNWFLALYVESRFGDEQDATSLGLLLQRSFD